MIDYNAHFKQILCKEYLWMCMCLTPARVRIIKEVFANASDVEVAEFIELVCKCVPGGTTPPNPKLPPGETEPPPELPPGPTQGKTVVQCAQEIRALTCTEERILTYKSVLTALDVFLVVPLPDALPPMKQVVIVARQLLSRHLDWCEKKTSRDAFIVVSEFCLLMKLINGFASSLPTQVSSALLSVFAGKESMALLQWAKDCCEAKV